MAGPMMSGVGFQVTRNDVKELTLARIARLEALIEAAQSTHNLQDARTILGLAWENPENADG